MKISRQELIDELLRITEAASQKVSTFRNLSVEQLNYREAPERWSILECIEHLNLYGDFYLPEIETRMLTSSPAKEAERFSSGIVGNYFANLMKVNDGKIKKMKTPKDKNPSGSSLGITTIERFLKQQERLKALLQQARNIDLTRTQVSISLTKMIKLRLGDTFRFFVYHIERHVAQAERVLASQGEMAA
jgi:hypothetical protein